MPLALAACPPVLWSSGCDKIAAMTELYGPGARHFQDQENTRALADRIEERLVRHALNASDRALLARLDMFFIASVDAEGRPSCSYKGGAPGFVRAVDDSTLAFPSYDGNGMFLTLGNIRETSAVGLLFIDFENQTRLRVSGDASVDPEDPLLAEIPESRAIVRVRVRDVFPNCARYIHKRSLVEPSRFVPSAGCETPQPSWKSADWAVDVVPKRK